MTKRGIFFNLKRYSLFFTLFLFISVPLFAANPAPIPPDVLAKIPAKILARFKIVRSDKAANLPPKLMKLFDLSWFTFFQAGMPTDPKVINQLLSKIDATFFLDELETMLLVKDFKKTDPAFVKIKSIVSKAKKSGFLSYSDVIDSILLFQKDDRIILLYLKRSDCVAAFPKALVYPTTVHPTKKRLGQLSTHSGAPVEIRINGGKEGDEVLNSREFAAHDSGAHGKPLLELSKNTTVEESLDREIAKEAIRRNKTGTAEEIDFFYEISHEFPNQLEDLAIKNCFRKKINVKFTKTFAL